MIIKFTYGVVEPKLLSFWDVYTKNNENCNKFSFLWGYYIHVDRIFAELQMKCKKKEFFNFFKNKELDQRIVIPMFENLKG